MLDNFDKFINMKKKKKRAREAIESSLKLSDTFMSNLDSEQIDFLKQNILKLKAELKRYEQHNIDDLLSIQKEYGAMIFKVSDLKEKNESIENQRQYLSGQLEKTKEDLIQFKIQFEN